MKNANTLQQKIIDGVALSILSRIPIFLIGNPGISKTSVIRRLAIENGYHCEAISGSHYSPEDVNGFPVNDNNELRLLKPRWLNNILKAKEEGKTSILFVDEITTANEFTQAALLTVIFDRIVGETPLPEDTIIISAGNYYHNLSSSFNMITPTMNRFMILNLRTSNQEIDIENFIKGPEHDTHDYKINKTAEIEYDEDAMNKIISEFFNEKLETLFDLNNPKMTDSYQVDGPVFGVPTFRTIYYTANLVKTAIKYKYLTSPSLPLLIDGLVGKLQNKKDYDKLPNNLGTVGLEMKHHLSSSDYISQLMIGLDLNSIINDDTNEVSYSALKELIEINWEGDTHKIFLTIKRVVQIIYRERDKYSKIINELMPDLIDKSSQHVGNNSTYKELVSMMEEFQLQQY